VLRQGSRSSGPSGLMSNDVDSCAWLRVTSRSDLSEEKHGKLCQGVVSKANKPGGVEGGPLGTIMMGLPYLGGVPIAAGSGRTKQYGGGIWGAGSRAFNLVNIIGSVAGDEYECT
jgi:hypothetical protein